VNDPVIDKDLKARIHASIDEGEFGVADIPAYLELLAQIATDTQDVQDEVDGWDRRIQLSLDGADDAWVTVEGGTFAAGSGSVDAPDLVLAIAASTAAQLFSGARDAKAAYMAGQLRIEGPIPDALRFQNILTIVNEEIEY
jgi:putative sterol carrier protein